MLHINCLRASLTTIATPRDNRSVTVSPRSERKTVVASDTSLPPETLIEALDLARRQVNLRRRADSTHLGELVLCTEAGCLALRAARREEWTAVQQVLRQAGIERDAVPLVYLIWSPSLLTLLFHQGIRRVGDLLGLTDATLRSAPGMSAADVADVQRALARYGLALLEEMAG